MVGYVLAKWHKGTYHYYLVLHALAQQEYHRPALCIATLGSILDLQVSWESGKLQLVRWSREVALFPVNTHPSTHPPPKFGRLGSHHLLSWQIPSNGMCGVPPPLLLKHLRILCGVPTLVWTSDQITSIGMCGVPPPCFGNILEFGAVSPPLFEHLTRGSKLEWKVSPPNSQLICFLDHNLKW